MTVIYTEPQRFSNVVKYEQGGQDFFSRDTATAEGAVALGDVVMVGTDPATQVKLAEAASTAVGVCIKTAADGEPTVLLVRNSVVANQGLNYGAGTEADLIADLKALGVLVRESQADWTFDV